MLPAPETTEPSELPIAVPSVAFVSPVFRSSRVIVLSPQFGTQSVPNAAASPEHGRLPVAMMAATVLVLGSNLATVPLGAFETQTDSSTAIQSGEPAYGKTASGLSRSIGILTPGVLTPGFGGRGDC